MAIEAVRLSTERPPDADERVTLFYLDDKEFTIPARPRANLSLQYLDKVKNEGSEYANAWLMEQMLGVEGYEALMNHEYLEPEQLKTIMDLCQKQTVGKLEQNRAARRTRG